MNLVFISYYFPPYNTIASQRAAKIAKQLLLNNQKVTIFTIELTDIPAKNLDLDFNKDLLSYPNLNIIRVPISKFGYEDSSSVNFLVRIYSGFLTRLFCSNGLFWYKNLKISILDFLKSNQVNYLILTGSPFITFRLGPLLRKKYNVEYVLDYRDLWTQNPRAPYFLFSRYLIKNLVEKKIINSAKAIITVSDGCAESLKGMIKNTKVQVYVCRNLPSREYLNFFKKIQNENDNDNNVKNTDFRLVIVGTVYTNCTLKPILKALKGLSKNILENRLLILYYGQSSSLLSKEIDYYGFTKYFKNFGFVSKKDSINAILSANLLVSLVDDGKNNASSSVRGLMTTKIFDYFLSGLPIINIAPIKSDISIFASEISYKNFYSFDANDTSGILLFLENQILKREINENQFNNAYFPLFNLEFDNVINKILE